MKTEPTEELEVKRVTKGDIIAEDGVLYTVEEHKKAETRTEVIRELKTIFKEKNTAPGKSMDQEPVGVKA